MTNYEYILNRMSPDIIADLLRGFYVDDCFCCVYSKDDCERNCIDGTLEWLNKEIDIEEPKQEFFDIISEDILK